MATVLRHLGPITSRPYFDYVSGPALVPIPGSPVVPFILHAPASDLEEADRVAAATLALNPAVFPVLEQGIWQHYQKAVAELLPSEVVAIARPEDVWKHVRIHEAMVRRRAADRRFYVMLLGGCDWEEEHGFQIVLRDGTTPVRFSTQDDHVTHEDAYGL